MQAASDFEVSRAHHMNVRGITCHRDDPTPLLFDELGVLPSFRGWPLVKLSNEAGLESVRCLGLAKAISTSGLERAVGQEPLENIDDR